MDSIIHTIIYIASGPSPSFNEELADLTEATLACNEGRELIGRLLAIYRCHYDFFGSKPELSRILLQELTFYSSEAFSQTRRRFIDGICAIVRSAQREGEIESTEDAQFIARHLFFVYSAAIRWWTSSASRARIVTTAPSRRGSPSTTIFPPTTIPVANCMFRWYTGV
jgi:Tetracyclin repressor-like, C-terminal domain